MIHLYVTHSPSPEEKDIALLTLARRCKYHISDSIRHNNTFYFLFSASSFSASSFWIWYIHTTQLLCGGVGNDRGANGPQKWPNIMITPPAVNMIDTCILTKYKNFLQQWLWKLLSLKIVVAGSLYIKRGKLSVTYVCNGGRGQLSSEWCHNENDVIMRMGAGSAVGVRHHNKNDVTMTIAGLWRCGDWRHVATGCAALIYGALCNRETIYIFMLLFVLLYFFPRLISAAADWMSAILPHMVWP